MMFREVLVGVDRRFEGRDAIALAELLIAEDGTMRLAHVVSGDPRLRREPAIEYEAVERQRALSLLTEARDRAGLEAELVCAESASVGRGLHALAESTGADLLVVGSSRRGLVGRMLLGDDACDAINDAPCAVAIAPSGYAQRTVAMHEIGVAYNGSDESEHAVSVARALAAARGSRLSACQVVSLPTYTFLGGGPVPVDDAVDDLVEDARKRIAALGGIVPHAVYGNPAEELTLYSESLDLLVVGSRDYGPVGRLIHGSTTRQLVHSVRCPLLVLTRTARGKTSAASTDEAQAAPAAVE